MKKFTAVVLALVMVLGFAQGVFASEWNQYMSYEAQMEFYIELNKPLDILKEVELDAPLDIQYLVENLLKTKFSADAEVEMSQDMKKAKAHMEYNIKAPVYISEDLKFGADTTFHMWMEYDLTDMANPMMKIIFKNPLDGKYLLIDYNKLAEEMGVSEALNLSEEIIFSAVYELQDIIIKAYKENSSLTANGNEYTITMTNNQLIDFFAAYIIAIFESDYMAATGVDTSALGLENVNVEQIVAIAKMLGIFTDENALVYKVKLDDKGYISEAEEKIAFDFNIFDIAAVLGVGAEEMAPITRENSDISFDLCAKVKYDRVNEETVVEMPVLTDENSYDFMELMGYSEDNIPEDNYYMTEDYTEYTYPTAYEYYYDSASGFMDRGIVYLDIESFAASCDYDDDMVSVTNSVDDKGNVVVTFTSLNFPTVTIEGNIYRDGCTVNGVEFRTRSPFKMRSGYDWNTYEAIDSLHVSMDVFKYVFAAKIESYEAYLLDENGVELNIPECYFYLVRPNPAYVGE